MKTTWSCPFIHERMRHSPADVHPTVDHGPCCFGCSVRLPNPERSSGDRIAPHALCSGSFRHHFLGGAALPYMLDEQDASIADATRPTRRAACARARVGISGDSQSTRRPALRSLEPAAKSRTEPPRARDRAWADGRTLSCDRPLRRRPVGRCPLVRRGLYDLDVRHRLDHGDPPVRPVFHSALPRHSRDREWISVHGVPDCSVRPGVPWGVGDRTAWSGACRRRPICNCCGTVGFRCS